MPEKAPVVLAHLLAAVAFAARVPPVNVRPEPMVVEVRRPPASVRTSAFGRPETVRLDVEAYIEEKAVEEAYGRTDATEEVETMLPAMNWLPWTASTAAGVEVPMPTSPLL